MALSKSTDDSHQQCYTQLVALLQVNDSGGFSKLLHKLLQQYLSDSAFNFEYNSLIYFTRIGAVEAELCIIIAKWSVQNFGLILNRQNGVRVRKIHISGTVILFAIFTTCSKPSDSSFDCILTVWRTCQYFGKITGMFDIKPRQLPRRALEQLSISGETLQSTGPATSPIVPRASCLSHTNPDRSETDKGQP